MRDHWGKNGLSGNSDRGEDSSSNKGMLMGVLIGVLLYSFTGIPAMVVLGLLIGLCIGKARK